MNTQLHKKIILSICILFLLAGAAALTGYADSFSKKGFQKDGENLVYSSDGISVVINKNTGMVTQISGADTSLSLEGVVVDAGLDEKYLFEQLGYKSLDSLATYELPLLWLKRKELPDYAVTSITAQTDGFTVAIGIEDYTVTYHYRISNQALSVDASLSTSSKEPVLVNGVAFLVRGIEGYSLSDTTFEFPGSTPDGRIPFSDSSHYRATVSDYSAPVVQIADASHYHNILFVNEVEKWTSGCYFDEAERPCAAFLSAAEGYISADSPMEIGTLYLPLPKTGEDAYASVSGFWSALGYHTPENSAADTLSAVYSGHPYGTMDTGYFNQLTLGEYAQSLQDIADMGFSAVWLLPVFQHTGDNVYEPIDQGLIDARYGGLEEARAYIEEAHAQNIKVLFDFVPHGPRPVYPFAKEHEDWVSKDQNGNNRIEWECVSFDYNHPEYYDYTIDLAKYYAETIDLDGARIDCSMGGLPNYFSAAGLRASASGLQGGVNIVKAIREGFAAGGKTPLLLPENFHPSPAYASCTDVFYDMPLYRCMYSLNHAGLSDAEYVSRLAHFLSVEQAVSVAGQKKLRFLGNHDTVTWTFDAERAQTLYGTGRAKALWMAIGWIDGVLYIYQGDEDPAAYHLEGENLTDFFTQLLSAKESFLPQDYATRYLDTQTPVFAFYRYDTESGDARLVLINLSDTTQSYSLSEGEDSVLAAIGDYSLADGALSLSPYAGVILQAEVTP